MKKSGRSMRLLVVVCLVMGLLVFGSTLRAQEQYTTKDLNEQLVMAELWVQASAEYRALCYQSFTLAKMNLDAFLSFYAGEKPVAVITDLDETVIDNSLYEAWLIGQDFGYSSKTWGPWMAAAKADAVPGAVEFCNYAKEKGVEVFYISNRKMEGYEGTVKNMIELGFPYVDEKHMLLRTDVSDKQPRREKVAQDYEIAFLMGDNLNDFLSVFGKGSVEERAAEADKIKEKWGRKFIVLPNPTYGDWDAAIINYNWGASPAEKDEMRKKHLRRWDYQP